MSLLDDEDTLPGPPRLAAAHTRLETVEWGAATSIGHRRMRNEDRFDSLGNTFVVADGMGGNAGGEIAAMVAVNHFLTMAAEIVASAPLATWTTAAHETAREVRRATQERGYQRAGTTMTAVRVETDRIVVVHVGDSRLYMVTDDLPELCSYDHNMANELDRLGENSAGLFSDVAPDALTSFFGIEMDALDVYVRELPRLRGRRLLLCTDGVHGQVRDQTIGAIANRLPVAEAAKELVQQADAMGGRDNATALLVQL